MATPPPPPPPPLPHPATRLQPPQVLPLPPPLPHVLPHHRVRAVLERWIRQRRGRLRGVLVQVPGLGGWSGAMWSSFLQRLCVFLLSLSRSLLRALALPFSHPFAGSHSTSLSLCLSVYLSLCLSAFLPICQSVGFLLSLESSARSTEPCLSRIATHCLALYSSSNCKLHKPLEQDGCSRGTGGARHVSCRPCGGGCPWEVGER